MSVDKTSLRTISQKEYLKRYLSKSKSKSKKKTSIKSNVKVIDDNDLTNHYVEENFDVETGEDAPVIAAIIDERPKLIKRLEEYKTSNRWAPVPEVNKGEEKSSVQNDHQSEQRLPSNEQNTSCHDLENHQKKRPHNSTSKKHETDDVSCSSSSSSDQFKSKRKKSRSSLAKNSEIKSDSLHHSEKKHSKTRDSSTMKTSRKCSPRRHSREQNRSDAETSVKENKQENNSLRNERNSVLAGGKESENNKNEKKVTAEQYYQWGKGLKQIEDENEKLTSDLREMSKPLARYVDDADLEKRLRDVGREGDPFAAMKINKNGEDLSDDSKPKYKGAYPQNRFGIAPGHKWDGVDRSNGYEVKWLGKAKAKEAVEEEAYKWSTADM